MSEQIFVPFINEYRSQQDYTPSFPSSSKNVAVKRSGAALPKYGNAPHSSVTDLLNASAGYTLKSVIAELEKRRAEFFAMACAAETRAREAENRCERAESKLVQETNLRLAAEQRLKEYEEDRQRQLQLVETRVKKAESRIKEAENDATSLTIALAKAYQKKAEAEATTRAVEEKARIIQALFLKSEANPRVSIEGNLIFGLLVFASKSKIWAMERAIRNVEARHRPQEDYLKNLLQKKTAKLPSFTDMGPLAEGALTAPDLMEPVDNDPAVPIKESKGLGITLKFIIYALAIPALIGACWGLIAAFLQN